MTGQRFVKGSQFGCVHSVKNAVAHLVWFCAGRGFNAQALAIGDEVALYFIGYDLQKKKDYQKLYDALEKLGAIRVLESTWCLKHTNTSAKELREYLTKFVDSDDRLIVVRVDDWSTLRALQTPNDL